MNRPEFAARSLSDRFPVLMIPNPVTPDLFRGPVFVSEGTGSRHEAGMMILLKLRPDVIKDPIP
jgi:hypothetical protein